MEIIYINQTTILISHLFSKDWHKQLQTLLQLMIALIQSPARLHSQQDSAVFCSPLTTSRVWAEAEGQFPAEITGQLLIRKLLIPQCNSVPASSWEQSGLWGCSCHGKGLAVGPHRVMDVQGKMSLPCKTPQIHGGGLLPIQVSPSGWHTSPDQQQSQQSSDFQEKDDQQVSAWFSLLPHSSLLIKNKTKGNQYKQAMQKCWMLSKGLYLPLWEISAP